MYRLDMFQKVSFVFGYIITLITRSLRFCLVCRFVVSEHQPSIRILLSTNRTLERLAVTGYQALRLNWGFLNILTRKVLRRSLFIQVFFIIIFGNIHVQSRLSLLNWQFQSFANLFHFQILGNFDKLSHSLVIVLSLSEIHEL